MLAGKTASSLPYCRSILALVLTLTLTLRCRGTPEALVGSNGVHFEVLTDSSAKLTFPAAPMLATLLVDTTLSVSLTVPSVVLAGGRAIPATMPGGAGGQLNQILVVKGVDPGWMWLALAIVFGVAGMLVVALISGYVVKRLYQNCVSNTKTYEKAEASLRGMGTQSRDLSSVGGAKALEEVQAILQKHTAQVRGIW